MTTRDHLVHHLQELYAFERDFLPWLAEAQHQSTSDRLRYLLLHERENMRSDLESLERALNLLSARYKQERNAVVPGLKEASARFQRQMAPSREQWDIHLALETIKVAYMLQGTFVGEIEMARAIGEQDVAKLLEETQQRQQDGLDTLEAFLPQLIADVNSGETRKAA